ncbi:hypothetical protein OAN307_c06050 [Octadecabacter antarcticus 307]|uniref:Uncharacterized protein n=1 Tax=Octadecabacter antarcticus 307 TaxID=391626 RepID=M9R260_9RHOB|nr:hypothetical protein [Octadecabacter antarcticus]AGI66332.1 hypothetical protein OAN307_c06050 [Octadecabacter antarcticus 307]
MSNLNWCFAGCSWHHPLFKSANLVLERVVSAKQWEFWIDLGGPFTDIVARRLDRTVVTQKLPSENPEH